MILKQYFFLFILLVLPFQMNGQNNLDSLYDVALDHVRKGEINASRKLYNELLPRYLAMNDTAKYYRIRKNIARTYYYDAAPTKMKRSVDESLTHCQLNHSGQSFEYAILLHEKGIYYLSTNILDSSIVMIEKALALVVQTKGALSIERAKYLSDLGVVYYKYLNLSKALEMYELSRDLRLEIDSVYSRGVATADLNIGEIYLNTGRYDAALERLNKSLDYYLSIGADKSYRVAQLYLDIGGCYKRKGWYEKAEKYQLKSAEVWIEMYGEAHFKVGYAYGRLASMYSKFNEYDKAIEYINRSIDILESAEYINQPELIRSITSKAIIELESGAIHAAELTNLNLIDYIKLDPDHLEQLSNVYLNISLVYLELDSGQLAEKFAMKSLLSYRKYKESSPFMESKVLSSIGRSFTLQERYERADSTLDVGLSLLNVNDIRKADLSKVQLGMFYTLVKGKLMNSLAAHQSAGNKQLLFEADSLIANLSFVTDQYLNKVGKEDQGIILSNQFSISELSQSILFELYELEQDPQYLERIFSEQERTKVFAVLNNLNSTELYKFHDVPDSLLKVERKLRIEITLGKQNLNLENDIALERQLEKVIKALGKYPSYRAVGVAPQYKTVSEMQEILADQEAFIQFSSFDNLIFASYLSARINKVYRIQLEDGFHDDLTSFMSMIKTKGQMMASHDLFEMLLGPIEDDLSADQVSQLHIVKDGLLNYLPFEILENNAGQMLLENYSINYHLSGSHWANTKDMTNDFSGNLLAFNPVFNNSVSKDETYREIVRGAKLGALKGAEGEILNLERLFKKSIVAVKGLEATETKLKEMVNDFRLLHFATHAIIDDQYPEFTKLVLSQDSLSDGYLHVYELYNMKLSSELVTLSACNTGYGKIERGQGVQSLAQAFAYAGCPNIVMSLWPVNDESTAELMNYFYQNLKDGQRKDEALNNAKLTYLENADPVKSHPYYWAGFVFSGDASPLNDSSRSLLQWSLVVLSLLVFLGVYFVYNSRRS